MTKPRLTLAEARILCEVDEAVRRGAYASGYGLEMVFSDVHDGNLYRGEIDGLIKQRLLRILRFGRRGEHPDFCDCDHRLMGHTWTVDLTDRAMAIFWPALYAKRGQPRSTAPSPQSIGGKARAQRLSPDRRREIARAAAQARWSKS